MVFITSMDDFFSFNFIIWIIIKNIVVLFAGKEEKLENLNIKGGIKMPKNQTSKNNGSTHKTNDGRKIHQEQGSQSVPPTTLSSPGKPSKQK